MYKRQCYQIAESNRKIDSSAWIESNRNPLSPNRNGLMDTAEYDELSTFSMVDKVKSVEFDFVASVYWALSAHTL